MNNIEEEMIAQALAILDKRLRKPNMVMQSPQAVKDYLRLHYKAKEHEEFCVLFLDHQNALIANEMMARGTLDQAAVYPREIVKTALAHNAASVILAHNHPSGSSAPSSADKCLTATMIRTLELIGVRVLDHFVVGNKDVYSFAQHGNM